MLSVNSAALRLGGSIVRQFKEALMKKDELPLDGITVVEHSSRAFKERGPAFLPGS